MGADPNKIVAAAYIPPDGTSKKTRRVPLLWKSHTPESILETLN